MLEGDADLSHRRPHGEDARGDGDGERAAVARDAHDGPVTHDKPLVIFSKINQAGKTVTITVKGNTSGSAFSVTGTIPATCKGLPTVQPNGTVIPPAQPTKPMPGTPTPTKPAPKPIDPKVQTDLVASRSSPTSGELGLAGLAFAAIAAGGAATSRHR